MSYLDAAAYRDELALVFRLAGLGFAALEDPALRAEMYAAGTSAADITRVITRAGELRTLIVNIANGDARSICEYCHGTNGVHTAVCEYIPR